MSGIALDTDVAAERMENSPSMRAANPSQTRRAGRRRGVAAAGLSTASSPIGFSRALAMHNATFGLSVGGAEFCWYPRTMQPVVQKYGGSSLKDKHRIRAEAERVVIVTGFQGIGSDTGWDEVTTLGRGGSDATAVALAAGLNAARCEIYTDVAGIFTADPRVVPEARKLTEITYEEMLELAQ